mmetsp:Transcript_111534/g.315791  ORF Transcript_111534/g.315791 Transcript_111534/m.315791 type:complete len:123 (-) Transcript_111534:67-435(-)
MVRRRTACAVAMVLVAGALHTPVSGTMSWWWRPQDASEEAAPHAPTSALSPPRLGGPIPGGTKHSGGEDSSRWLLVGATTPMDGPMAEVNGEDTPEDVLAHRLGEYADNDDYLGAFTSHRGQ